MSVLSCCRYNCENVMCDTCVPGIGYVCYGCQSEFKKYLIDKNINPITEDEIYSALKEFVETEKGSFLQEMDIETKVNIFFKPYTD